jgi:FemAB-related protein (PEP-CTERM system-associated)
MYDEFSPEPSASNGVASAGDAVPSNASAPALVRPATEADRTAWNGFVFAEPQATFFHRFEWCDVLGRAFGHRSHYLLAERAGRIVGVLPLAEVKSALFGHSLISTPFCVYGGIVATDAAAFSALEQAACELARRLGVDYLEMRNRARRHEGWPGKDLYVTFRKPIDEDSEKNMLAIPRKQRAVVRKGIKEGCAAELDPGVERHYAMYSESLRNLGTPVFSRRYLEVLREVFGADCDVLTVTHQGTPIASCLNFYFRDEVLPYYGGGTLAARAVGGNDFMYWEIMERARQRGCRLFDYGRSKLGTGAYDFKKFWGFEPEPLHYEYFLVRAAAMPNLSPTNPKYDRMIQLWRRMPLWLTQWLGPPLARHLG